VPEDVVVDVEVPIVEDPITVTAPLLPVSLCSTTEIGTSTSVGEEDGPERLFSPTFHLEKPTFKGRRGTIWRAWVTTGSYVWIGTGRYKS
jgi:hypothetical protein